MKNIVIVSSSLRINSNSEILAKKCEIGAKIKNNVEFISLKNKKIEFCRGCLACQKTQKCVINDDVFEIMNKIKKADVLVFATPIYYYGLSGQLKTLLDRLNPLYADDYKFREVYMIATAAENSDDAFDKAYNGLLGWVECFEKASLKKIIKGAGINNPNEALKHLDILDNAYRMGVEI